MFRPLQNLDRYDIVLASGSPRRRELLSMLDVDFSVDTSHPIDEVVPPGIADEDVPLFLSQLKADAYPLETDDRRLVITADTVVLIDGRILGKPKDEAEAARMLRMISGKTQRVVTGVTVRDAERSVCFSAESKVNFAPLTDDEISWYVGHYRPLDKAGAYGIQEWIGAVGITGIEGSFYNVMGLPVQKLYKILKEW